VRGRRAFLATGASALCSALAGCSALSGDSSSSGGQHALSETTVKTVNATGSPAGTLTLPTGAVTVVDVFSTTCDPCKTELTRLKSARSRLSESVSFVSVTNQVLGGTFTEADLRGWWDAHGGPWPVAIDTHGAIDRELSVTGLPTLAVLDSSGRVAWTHRGVASVEAVVPAVRNGRG